MKSIRDVFYTFDEPVIYKKLRLYPITMKHYYVFNGLASCLLLEKNSIQDNPELAIKAIGMSYLEYLFYVNNDKNKLTYLLDGLLRLSLGKPDDENFTIGRATDTSGKPLLIIEDEEYNSDDFDELREIIAEQNMLDLPNEKIQKNVRDALEEAQRFKQKLNKSSVASLEEQLVAFSLYSGIPFREIYEMPIRKFVIGIRRSNHMIMSNIYLNASMSGFVKFKDKSVLKGWLADLEMEDKYGDVKMTPEQLASKNSFEDAKNK